MKGVIVSLYKSGCSIPQISTEISVPRSTVRYHIKRAGILRNHKDAMQLSAKQGRLGSGLRGKKRVFSDEWRNNMSLAKLLAGEQKAKGISLKPNGYIEITRGPNKGRPQHCVIMEQLIGRRLLGHECVHHIDKDRTNNSPENLQLMTKSEHSSLHALENNSNRNRDNTGRYI